VAVVVLVTPPARLLFLVVQVVAELLEHPPNPAVLVLLDRVMLVGLVVLFLEINQILVAVAVAVLVVLVWAQAMAVCKPTAVLECHHPLQVHQLLAQVAVVVAQKITPQVRAAPAAAVMVVVIQTIVHTLRQLRVLLTQALVVAVVIRQPQVAALEL
jgi:hypothetical protein